MANRDTVFRHPGGEVTGQQIADVLATLKCDKVAGQFAVETIHEDHRTHQQSFMRLFICPMLRAWSKDKEHGRFDGRNESTVNFADQCFKSDEDPAFPYI